MDESPHKCPVCSRSFNQRSNLKTHLLTHTDHKPYECSSCGKVFRRNCDLRRHALTHAVGDVPTSDHLDVGDDSRNLSGDEEDTVLEVDSPANSPHGRRVSSASPLIADIGNDDIDDNDEEDDTETTKETELVKAPEIHNVKDHSEVTHCHHEGNGEYTMRPSHENSMYYNKEYKKYGTTSGDVTDARDHHLSVTSQKQQQKEMLKAAHENSYLPMLHVRRDLHHRNSSLSSSTVTSGGMHPMPQFGLSSVPFRKRPIGLDGEPHPIMIRRTIGNIHHSAHSMALGSPSNSSKLTSDCPIPSQLGCSDPIQEIPLALNTSGTSNSVPLVTTVPQVPTQLPVRPQPESKNVLPPPAQPVAPRRTGFSIEDIMRK